MSVDSSSVRVHNSSAPVVATTTAHRVTPTDGPTFGEVMRDSAKQMLRGANAAVRLLPTGPIVAASLRPATSLSVGASTGSSAVHWGTSAEGSALNSSEVDGNDAVEGALARSQDMNIYLIELQERVASQNRAFTTYSNVLKAKHETVKNAINNIR